MNVIFLDFDGVLDTSLNKTNEQIENKVRILGEICKEYNCKVVIEASIKDLINEEDLTVEGEWLNFLFNLFKKYEIEVIGRTPNVRKYFSKNTYTDIWKEDEIKLYLKNHKEIEHFCIIDDDDRRAMHLLSDLETVKDYLITTKDFCDNEEKEGLLIEHKEQVGKILQKENRFKKFI